MISLFAYPLLFLAGLVAGFVDAVAGGGGMITLPVLLATGMSPADALGTNKLQSTFGSTAATWHYAAAGLVHLKDCYHGIVFTAIGAALGTWAVRQIDADILRQLIPWLLIAIVLYTVLRPNLGADDVRPSMEHKTFHLVFGLTHGFYDGSFGPGTGSFWAMAYMLGLGFNLARATAYTKVMNCTSNWVSLIVFTMGGHVQWTAGLVMGVGQLIGARIGAGMVVKRGTGFIRPVFITMVMILTARLLWQNFMAN